MSDERITVEFKVGQLMHDVRKALLAEDASLRKLADLLENVSAPTLSRLEHGRLPDLSTFMELVLQCDLEPGDYFEKVHWVRTNASTTHAQSVTLDANTHRRVK